MKSDLTDADLDEMIGDGTAVHLPFVRAGLEIRRLRLSDDDRNLLSYLSGWCHAAAGDVTIERARYDKALAVLDRVIGASIIGASQ